MLKKFRKFISVPVMMLLIATSTLLYSGYRAQLNQANQTARSAGFELLKSLNILQMIVDAGRYTPDQAASYIAGWTEVLLIEDMASFVSSDVDDAAQALHHLWQQEFEHLDQSSSNNLLTKAIKKTRSSLKSAIHNLH